MKIRVDQIKPSPFAPRTEELDIAALAESIGQHGQLQPIRVRPIGDRYECVFGLRRLAACCAAGLDEVDATVVELDDKAARMQVWEENERRKDLNAIDRAKFIAAYRDEYGGTQAKLGRVFGLSQATISELLLLLEESAETQTLLQTGDRLITREHVRLARQVLGKDIEGRTQILREAADEGLSSREVQRRAASHKRQTVGRRFEPRDEEWRQLPSVKHLTELATAIRDAIKVGKEMVEIGVLAPEACQFMANRIDNIIQLLQTWKEELEDANIHRDASEGG